MSDLTGNDVLIAVAIIFFAAWVILVAWAATMDHLANQRREKAGAARATERDIFARDLLDPEWPRVAPKPLPPPSRLRCDSCGWLSPSGEHTSWGCRLAKWLAGDK